MTTRRKLLVGPDGKADVTLLTDPIPRHLSLVGWGANDEPAATWKSAEAPQKVLRTFPAEMVDLSLLSLDRVQMFVGQTLDALIATVGDVLGKPLRAEERSAQIRALFSQAGARLAAFSSATDRILGSVVKTYKSQGLQIPGIPTGTTLQGEIDRRQYMAHLQMASSAIVDSVLSSMQDPGQFGSTTESILHLFGDAGSMFCSWAASLPDGVVGLPTPDTSTKATGRTGNAGTVNHSHEYTTGDTETGTTGAPGKGSTDPHSHKVKPGELFTEMGGARPHRHSIDPRLATGSQGSAQVDQITLRTIHDQLQKLTSPLPTSTENTAMTIEDLQKLASENPIEFFNVLKTALKAARVKAPDEVKKFVWGETGVDQENAGAILSDLGNMQGGEAIASLIAAAVAGIDVGEMAEKDSVQVASTMRSGLVKHVLAEIKNNPNGELSTTIKSAVKEDLAPEIAETIREAFNAYITSTQNQAPDSPFGFDFQNDDETDWLAPQRPTGVNFRQS